MRLNKIILSDTAWEQLLSFSKNEIKLIKRIFEIVDNIKVSPFEGIGKPEPLKGDLKGFWSRRVTDEHRIVYKIEDDCVYIFQVKGHYLDK